MIEVSCGRETKKEDLVFVYICAGLFYNLLSLYHQWLGGWKGGYNVFGHLYSEFGRLKDRFMYTAGFDMLAWCIARFWKYNL